MKKLRTASKQTMDAAGCAQSKMIQHHVQLWTGRAYTNVLILIDGGAQHWNARLLLMMRLPLSVRYARWIIHLCLSLWSPPSLKSVFGPIWSIQEWSNQQSLPKIAAGSLNNLCLCDQLIARNSNVFSETLEEKDIQFLTNLSWLWRRLQRKPLYLGLVNWFSL